MKRREQKLVLAGSRAFGGIREIIRGPGEKTTRPAGTFVRKFVANGRARDTGKPRSVKRALDSRLPVRTNSTCTFTACSPGIAGQKRGKPHGFSCAKSIPGADSGPRYPVTQFPVASVSVMAHGSQAWVFVPCSCTWK